MSIQAISRMLGWNRKTVRKYLLAPEGAPAYSRRPPRPGKLAGYEKYLEQRLAAGVWNGRVLLRELQQLGYGGGYTILTDWLRPRRQAGAAAAVMRYETAPGRQGQVDWGHLGTLEAGGRVLKLSGFTLTLGYSRAMWAWGTVDEKLGTLLRMHERAFEELGGVPEEILYDRMRTVWTGMDERGEVVWNSVFLDFARYWGFRPRLCRAWRPQTKGKVESGVKYLRRNFLLGLQGREVEGLEGFNGRLREWLWGVANQRVHGTTHERVCERLEQERRHLQPVGGRPSYAYLDEEQRKVARDGFVSWEGSRYSVPWAYAGKEVWVRAEGAVVEIYYGGQRIAQHAAAVRHKVVREAGHHEGIGTSQPRAAKTVVQIRSQAPAVEVRPLEAYDSVAWGGGR
jgi:transposase